MNYKVISSLLGRILLLGAAMMAIPTIMAAFDGGNALPAFLITEGCLVAVGLLLSLVKAPLANFYSREGYVIVVLSWVLMSVFGCLPFLISGAIPDFFSAFFETVSGFTTTGSTVLSDIEALPKSLLFWRAFTHWIGGMGILVFMLALTPRNNARMMHIMKAEVPGPRVDKLVARTRVTAQILYGIYIGLTLIEIIFLLCGGCDLFDSITLAFSTAGTGGFSSYNASIAHFGSLYVEVVITVFMFLFAINFNLFYLILLGQVGRALKSEELRVFILIVLGAIGIITIDLVTAAIPVYESVGEALRYSSFQVVSVISSTGFISADFIQWPTLSQTVLVLLMFVGACAGSTGGGLKVSRVILLVKTGVREIRRLLNPQTVTTVKVDKKPVEEEVIAGSGGFFVLYILLLLLSTLLLALDGFDFSTNFTSVLTCLNNIGPTLGNVVGATGNFSVFSPLSKMILSFCMLAGRLNIYPVLILFAPATWKKSS